jgi:hypothetical protein
MLHKIYAAASILTWKLCSLTRSPVQALLCLGDGSWSHNGLVIEAFDV